MRFETRAGADKGQEQNDKGGEGEDEEGACRGKGSVGCVSHQVLQFEDSRERLLLLVPLPASGVGGGSPVAVATNSVCQHCTCMKSANNVLVSPAIPVLLLLAPTCRRRQRPSTTQQLARASGGKGLLVDSLLQAAVVVALLDVVGVAAAVVVVVERIGSRGNCPWCVCSCVLSGLSAPSLSCVCPVCAPTVE